MKSALAGEAVTEGNMQKLEAEAPTHCARLSPAHGKSETGSYHLFNVHVVQTSYEG